MSQLQVLTEQIAHAAAWDAGNRSMRAAGRTRWSKVDLRAAGWEFDRLWPKDAKAAQ